MAVRVGKPEYLASTAAVCYALALLPMVPRPLSSLAGVMVCFVTVGVLGTYAIFPGRVRGLVRSATAVAFVIAAGIVGGLILNVFPGGLVRFNWVTYGLLISLAAYAVARSRGAEVSLVWHHREMSPPGWGSIVKVFSAACLLVAAALISLSSVASHHKTFTELWLVPVGATNSPLGAKSAVLGIKSHESTEETYTVVLHTGQRTLTNVLKLAPNQAWTQTVPLEGRKAVASVYKSDELSQPYRSVWVGNE